MMKISKMFAKSRPISFPGGDALFASLIITDVLAPFFIWPHWTGRFYPGWAVFFSSGLAHWLQALALLLAWPVLRAKFRGRLGLGLLAGFHLFCPPPTLDDQFISGLAAASAWWLAALPAVVAAGREFMEDLTLPSEAGSRQFRLMSWLALAANPLLILTLVGPFLADPAGSHSEVAAGALAEIVIFGAFLLLLLLAGGRTRIFIAPVCLAALVSLGGILWLWSDLVPTEPDLDAFLTGLLAIHITLLPVLGAVVLVIALTSLILCRRRGGFRWPAPPFRPGWLSALALTPLAGLGLLAFPLWAEHLSRSCLDPPAASEPASVLAAGPLSLPIPDSLEVARWLTFINWAQDMEKGEAAGPASGPPPEAGFSRAGNQRRPRPWREVHGMVLIESEYRHPSLAEQEFEEAWQRLLGYASDHPGFPKIINDLSDQFGRSSRLLIHFYPPRRSGNEGSMIMRLTFLQQQSGGYIRLVESAKLEAKDVDPARIGELKEEKIAEFRSRVEEVAAAYWWVGGWKRTPAVPCS